MLSHGGRVLAASRRYGIAPEHWLDLSTGISPWSWLEDAAFQPSLESWAGLPEDQDGLLKSALNYYGAPALPVAGSQAAIQLLPRLRAPSRVGILTPTYAEHAEHWQRAGHGVEALHARQLDQALPRLDVLVVCNPNNPDGRHLRRRHLLGYADALAARGGWLVVDEAFADAAPEPSLAGDTHRPGLIVLRSFGKFFGLAGARLGFVMCQAWMRRRLREALGPWHVAGPTREVAIHALGDTGWQDRQVQRLNSSSRRLAWLLHDNGLSPCGGSALFQFVRVKHARALVHQLAAQAILVRGFRDCEGLRFGLPRTEQDWSRLRKALASCQRLAA
ncbi:MAG: threonine-phosphate decarboxylase CobD [Panacagrimonas sp.]